MSTGIPAQQSLVPVLFNKDGCVKWLIEVGIIWRARTCSICGKLMLLNSHLERYRHYCISGRRDISMWKNTFFSRSKLEPNQIMNLVYLWLAGADSTMLGRTGGHSSTTIANFIQDVTQMVAECVEERSQMIGGAGIIVELDESKLSKRKFNRGHHVEGVWVIGGVERTAERKLFAVQVENRNSETISQIIETYVHPGSIIHTDCWRGYDCLRQMPQYDHQTVNHSLHFKDPVTQVHTNSIEGTWAAIKGRISKRYRCGDALSNHLNAFIWKRQNHGRLWEAMIEALKYYEYIE